MVSVEDTTRFSLSPPEALIEKSRETVHLSSLEKQLREWWSSAPKGILCGITFSASQEESSRARKSQDFLS